MGAKESAVLRRLKKTIEKVKFLLSTNLSQWLYIGSAAPATRRRLSFKDNPGLLDIVSTADGSEGDYQDAVSAAGSPSPPVIIARTTSSLWSEIPGSPGSSRSVSRTASDIASSSSSGDVDVDKRAEAFIANFWKHIQMERQVSLDLRYCKSNSLERTASDRWMEQYS